MSEAPENGQTPELSKRKPLPWEERDAAKHPGFKAAAFIYLAAALIMVGVAGYMLISVGHPVMSVPVIAPAIGAVYFTVRFAMMLRPKI
jgi:CHASE2 domain-containing sensor protein